MAVDQRRGAAIIPGPVVAHGQAEFVGLSRRFPEHAEAADALRAASDIVFLQASVRHGQLAAVEDVMADQAFEELDDVAFEFAAFQRHLFERFRQTVVDFDVAAFERLFELGVVVAGDAEGNARRDHIHDDAQDFGAFRATIDLVADEDQLAAVGVRHAVRRAAVDDIAEFAHQGFELVETAVDVADQVERAGLVLLVVPQGLAHDLHRRDVFGRVEDRDLAELFLEAAQRSA